MSGIKILWADDEIDMLKPQLFFLEKKGYEVVTVSNGHDALEEFQQSNDIDVIFLDESMPGITGLETLARLKQMNANVPIVMITKNEAENIMEEAIGSQIDDYLIKPVNPNQILLTLKRLIDNQRLVSEKTMTDYQQEFRKILMEINSGLDLEGWVEIYKKIISWELKMDQSDTTEMMEILQMQKTEANAEFAKFVEKNYERWIQGGDDSPVMSHNLLKSYVLPELNDKPTYVFLLDNLRFDQWRIIEPLVTSLFRVEEEKSFYSILPTSTQYSRNAIFAGLLPSEIKKHHRTWWLDDHEEGGKNMHEADLLRSQVNRLVRKELQVDYLKVVNVAGARQMGDTILDYMNNDLTVVVYNFIDMLSHARTEMEVLKELAGNEKAYRSLTKSWYQNSPLKQALEKLSEKDVNVYITTDHGTIRVHRPSKVVGDKHTTTNLRYKSGRNLNYERKDVFEMRDPESYGLPKVNISTAYIFAKEDRFFLYPNNYNKYNNMYTDTFQHGGISLEEVICPFIKLSPK
ncbi:MAG: response regulator [Bacteroidota bacterium]